ncbi:MAG: HAMP domain-containing histidine kinase [Chitinophagales bacterium]|nr:HAMP domain-containing histidine kinase [Chitinophagales bacterium]
MHKWIKISAWVLGLLSLVCFSISLIKINTQAATDQAMEIIQQRYNQAESSLHQYLAGDHDKIGLQSLDENPFNIEIYHEDSIFYWNHAASISKPNARKTSLIKTIGDSTLHSRISLNIQAFNKIQPFKEVQLQDENGQFTQDFNGQTFHFGVKTDKKHPQFILPAWVMMILSFSLFSLYLFYTIKLKLKTKASVTVPSSLLLLSIVSVFALHFFPPFIDLMQGTIVAKNLNERFFLAQRLGPYIVSLVTSIILVGFLSDMIERFQSYFEKRYHMVAIISGTITLCAFAGLVYAIEGFVLNPNVNLEIESLLKFDGASFILITGFIISMLLVFQTTQLLYEWLNKGQLALSQKVLFISIGWCIGLLITWLAMPLHLPIWKFLIFIIAYTLIMDAYAENQEKKITYLLWWMIMYSVFLSIILFYFGLKKDVIERSSFIASYYAKTDESIIHSMIEIQDSLLARNVYTSIASLENNARLDKKDLYQFMFDQIAPVMPENMDIDIELFDKNTGLTVFSNYFADFYKLNQTYTNAHRVNRQVYHNPFEDKYITRLEIIRPFPINASWYLFIIAQHTAAKKALVHSAQNFSYAVFSRNQLIEKTDNFQSAPDLSIIASVSQDTIINGYSLVVSRPSDQYKIVSWKKISGLIKPISLFSFIFTWSGILMLVLTLFNTRFGFLPANLNLKFGSRSSLKTKIQLAIIILIVVTFLIIGSITAMYFKNLIEVNQITKNKEETITVIHNIRSSIQNLADDEYAANFLSSKLNELSYIHDKELSLYDHSGRLLASTSRDETSSRIPFRFWEDHGIRKDNELSSFLTTSGHEFIALFLNDKRAFAYLDIEYHTHDHSADNILDFLSTILNAYIFLFLIAGAIAITIANSITQPLTKLADKLKRFKLGKTNELLEWKSNDEIGTLIDEYNNLTQELEDSVSLLAKTERDIAWREMAKQVAHEIKNPLTPMKLNIQYLERTTKESPERAHEMIQKISSSLIEQIDNLSQIASEFSNFATMPQATNEKISLNEIVETIHDLFRKRDDMDINMIEPIDDLYIFADKNHLVRILNNLLKNAIQAIPDDRRGRIEIELKRQENDALIRISDNGTGIPDHMKDKVFTPNFTTKSSGTGLGLAIASNMVDSFNGRIYFETRPGKGTDFYLSIPLMRLEDYINEGKRVSLD